MGNGRILWREYNPSVCKHREICPSCTIATQPSQVEKREPGRRCNIKWPKASEASLWPELDSDFSMVLEHSLRGQADRKLNLLADILYEERKARFGLLSTKPQKSSKGKERREAEIEALVRTQTPVVKKPECQVCEECPGPHLNRPEMAGKHRHQQGLNHQTAPRCGSFRGEALQNNQSPCRGSREGKLLVVVKEERQGVGAGGAAAGGGRKMFLRLLHHQEVFRG